MKVAKIKQKQYIDRNSRKHSFQVDDPVYLKNHRKTRKLDSEGTHYDRILDQTGPLSFVLGNELSGATTKTHARHIYDPPIYVSGSCHQVMRANR